MKNHQTHAQAKLTPRAQAWAQSYWRHLPPSPADEKNGERKKKKQRRKSKPAALSLVQCVARSRRARIVCPWCQVQCDDDHDDEWLDVSLDQSLPPPATGSRKSGATSSSAEERSSFSAEDNKPSKVQYHIHTSPVDYNTSDYGNYRVVYALGNYLLVFA